MANGGHLTVRTFVTDGAYNIVFADSGRGMSPADLQRLFQPFRTSFPSGTGLGMAISYRIVQEHGGRIRLESRPNAGASFYVELPVTAGRLSMESTTAHRSQIREPAPPRSTRTIQSRAATTSR